jgi:hypothetical protein
MDSIDERMPVLLSEEAVRRYGLVSALVCLSPKVDVSTSRKLCPLSRV